MTDIIKITPDQVQEMIESVYFFTGAEGIAGAHFNHQCNVFGDGGPETKPINEFVESINEAFRILTFCVIVLKNGWTVTGTSSPIDPKAFNPTKGEDCAYDRAIEQIYPLVGFMLKSELS